MSENSRREPLEASTTVSTQPLVSSPEGRLPTLTIAAHPDPARVGERTRLPGLASGREVDLSRLTPAFAPCSPGAVRHPLGDPHLSRRPLRLRPEAGGIRLLRGELRGDCRVDGEPLDRERLIPADRLGHGVVVLLARRVALLLHETLPGSQDGAASHGLVGASDALRQVRGEIRRAAELEVPVLLLGETGTGKELVARAIHEAGPRNPGPWVAVNMAAVPPSLAAAELFGAVRGAFTGAESRRHGYFRRAHGGTLFLDEIAATPVEIQNLLLRALESREIQPVGADATERVDVRVLAASDSDLETAMGSERFRSPLFYRLSGWEIHLPPLRHRRDDIPRLLLHFLSRELGALGAGDRLTYRGPYESPWLPAPLVAQLVALDWPGNVRQLANVARRLAAGARELPHARLDPALERHLGLRGNGAPQAEAAGPSRPPRPRRYRSPDSVDDSTLLSVLAAKRWRLQPTAEALGISRTSLYALIDRCPQIRKAADLGRAEVEESLAAARGDVDAAAELLQVSRHGLLLRLRRLGLLPDGGSV